MSIAVYIITFTQSCWLLFSKSLSRIRCHKNRSRVAIRERTICKPIPPCSRPVILLANNLIATSLLASHSFESGQKRISSSTHHLPSFFINRHQNLETSYISRYADSFQLTQGFKRRRNERWMRTKKTRVRCPPYFTTSNSFSKLRYCRRG